MAETLENDLYNLVNPEGLFIYGKTGNFNGTVDVLDKPNYIYVQINAGRDVVEVWNDYVPSVKDLMVVLEPNKYKLGELMVVGLQNVYPGQSFPFITIKKHGETHTWPSYDTVSIYHRQVIPLLVRRAGNNRKVNVYAGYYKTTTGFGFFEGEEDFDLAPYVPASGGRYVLLYLSPTGVLSVRSGQSKALSLLTMGDTPNLQPDETGLAVVRLYVGQYRLADVQNPDRTDIIDIRYINPFDASYTNLVTGTFPYIDLDITGSYPVKEGRFKWDNTLGMPVIGRTGLYDAMFRVVVPPVIVSGAYYEIQETDDVIVFLVASTGVLPFSGTLGQTHRIANESDVNDVYVDIVSSGTYKGLQNFTLSPHEDVIATCYTLGRWV